MIKLAFSCIMYALVMNDAYATTFRNTQVEFSQLLSKNPDWAICTTVKVSSYAEGWEKGQIPYKVTMKCAGIEKLKTYPSIEYFYPGSRYLVLNPAAKTILLHQKFLSEGSDLVLNEQEIKRILQSSSTAYPILITGGIKGKNEFIALPSSTSLSEFSDQDFFILTNTFEIKNKCEDNWCNPLNVDLYFLSLEAIRREQ